MMFWWLFVILNAIYIGALLWCVMAIRATTKLGAEVLDIHTEKLRQAFGEIAALRESQFPRYMGTPIECETPEVSDMAWTAHDAAVSDAIAHALPGANTAEKLSQDAAHGQSYREAGHVGLWQNQPMRESGGGVRLPDPESAPFFTQSGPGVTE